MQIQLKQREIEAALKLYISQQGITLLNKVVDVVFISGRKDNGLTAELTIEDASPAVTNTFALTAEAAYFSPSSTIAEIRNEAVKETTEVIATAQEIVVGEPVKASKLFG